MIIATTRFRAPSKIRIFLIIHRARAVWHLTGFAIHKLRSQLADSSSYTRQTAWWPSTRYRLSCYIVNTTKVLRMFAWSVFSNLTSVWPLAAAQSNIILLDGHRSGRFWKSHFTTSTCPNLAARKSAFPVHPSPLFLCSKCTISSQPFRAAPSIASVVHPYQSISRVMGHVKVIQHRICWYVLTVQVKRETTTASWTGHDG